jgi:hypothetical protein
VKKKWVISVALAGGITLFSMPLVGFSASAEEHADSKVSAQKHDDLKEIKHLKLESGGIAVPMSPPPKDGIIGGSAGCLPDVHEYNKNIAEEHLVFSVSLTSKDVDQEQIKYLIKNNIVTVYAQVYSDDTKLLEVPLFQHPTPDPNTGKEFLVTCLFINHSDTNLPTGDYTYKFIAKTNYESKKNKPDSNIVAKWTPENNTFTVVNK